MKKQFHKVSPGDRFVWKEVTWLKVHPLIGYGIKLEHNTSDKGVLYNGYAVSLENGCLYWFDGDESVNEG